MYASGADHPHKDAAARILSDAEAGRIDACSSVEVLQEILHRYTCLGRPWAAQEVYGLFVESCADILPVMLTDLNRARDLLAEVPGLRSRDAVHAAVMINNGVEWIASFDKHFDRIPGIRRLEPDVKKRE